MSDSKLIKSLFHPAGSLSTHSGSLSSSGMLSKSCSRIDEGCGSWYINSFQSKQFMNVMILLLTFPHSFSSYTLCMLLLHAYYILFTFLFPSTDFLSFHALPYSLYTASCTVCLLMHSPAQSCIVLHSLLINA